jgi:hypothetical protein
MSYDFRLFLPQPGVDPLVTAQTDPDEESDKINQALPLLRKRPGRGRSLTA